MGNSNGKHKLQRRFTGKFSHSQIGNLAEHGFARYNDKELTLLDRMFQDLAKRSPDETMSKETFLQYFALPGILGERLFAVFDKKKNGVIDFEEFVSGLARYNRGSLQEKIEMLFEMYDMDGHKQVKPEELSLILYSVITPTTSLFYSTENDKGIIKKDENGGITHVSKLTRQTVEKMVNDAFEYCDTNKDGLLSQKQFTEWVKQNPGALQLLETVFVKHIWSGFDAISPTQSSEDEMEEKGVKISPRAAHATTGNISPRMALSTLSTLANRDSVNAKDKSQKSLHKRTSSLGLGINGKSRNTSHKSLSALSMGSLGPPGNLQSALSVTSFDQPTQAMPPHFNALYDKLTQIYLDEGDDGHCVYICNACKYKYYTSIHMEEPLNETKQELNHYNQYVIFNKKEFNDKMEHKKEDFEIKFCPQCGTKLDKNNATSVSQIMNLATAATVLPSVSTATLNEVGRQGILYKIGAKFKSFINRYYVIKEKFLYTFKKQNDQFPINVVFIAGWYINEMNDNHIDKGWYGVELTAPVDELTAHNTNGHRTHKILYSKSKKDRDEWVKCLQRAAATISIKQHYKIGKTLGKGHFSVVHLGINRDTKKECAVKIVEKSRIDAREKMSLRNEIAMMRLVNHPCIIRMLDVFEDKKCIYMVMTLAPYGDFFGRWKKRKIFEEDIARIIIWKLLDATQYLHALGIVHRDLKPENILCLDENDDTQIVISDFGLSKFAAPHTEMTMPCGTLAYVAPEVLSMKGYGRKVDLWSLGCIMHLLLRGVLPFDGHSKDEVVEKTLNKKLDLTHQKWNRVTSVAKDLIAKLLIKDPNERISLQNALKHKWFDKIKEEPESKDLQLHNDISPTIHAVISGADETPLPTPTPLNINSNSNGNSNGNQQEYQLID